MGDPLIDPTDAVLRPLRIPERPLQGRKALVVGIANTTGSPVPCAPSAPTLR